MGAENEKLTKDAIPRNFPVNADKLKIMKLARTCFTERGFEIPG